MTTFEDENTSTCTFCTRTCVLPVDLVRVLCEFAWGVCPKKHLFEDLAHVYAYQCAIPDVLLNPFVPRISTMPKSCDTFNQRYAETLMLNRFDCWTGFTPLITEGFVPNPYRSENPYVPTNDFVRRGHWSNCLWFLMDILKKNDRKFYRRPLQKQLRKLFTGGIENWNDIWGCLGTALDDLECADNLLPKQWYEELWADLIPEQFENASFVEDHIYPDDPQLREDSVFDRWNRIEKTRYFSFFRRQRP